MRKCRKCSIEKTIKEFGANPRNKFNLRVTCKKCSVAAVMEKYKANPEIFRKKSAQWREDNPVRYREYAVSYMAENRKKHNEHRRLYRLKNIEREKEKDRRYMINNRAKVNAKNSRRRASETSATPIWLTPIHRAQIAEFYEVANAKSMQTGISYDVDHIMPLRGRHVRGLHVPWNLQILTEAENSKKNNKITERGA